MNDMRAVIVPKSDQINADDLLTGPMTITVAKVSIRPGTEQPVSIHFEGDNNKPYKPCKSMARVMVSCWGPDANAYVGRSMTLYCDPKVMWGGLAVGGIRISHMSNINSTVTMALTATKGNKRPFTVQPLAARESATSSGPRRKVSDILTDIEQEFAEAIPQGRVAVETVVGSDDVVKALDKFQNGALDKLQAIIKDALEKTAEVENGQPEDGGAGGGTTDGGTEDDPSLPQAQSLAAQFQRCATEAEITALVRNPKVMRDMDAWKTAKPDLWSLVDTAAGARRAKLGAAG